MLGQVMADNGFPVPLVEGGDCRVLQFHSGIGEGVMIQYGLSPGVSLMYNDLHMESYNSTFRITEGLLRTGYCRQGRMEYPAGPSAYSYVGAGDLELDRQLGHQGHFIFPPAHYHGITVGFAPPQAAQSLKEWIRGLPVDLIRLQDKFCASRHPKMLHGTPSVDHIPQEFYAVLEQIKFSYFRIKVLELFLYLDALEPPKDAEKPCSYESQVEKAKVVHHPLAEDLERHYTIAELSERFPVPATVLKECFKSIYGQPINTYMCNFRMDQAALLLQQESQMGVAEIAEQVGYDSSSKFAVAFKEVEGRTPLGYRWEGQQASPSKQDQTGRTERTREEEFLMIVVVSASKL